MDYFDRNKLVYYPLDLLGIKRELPLVAISPKLKIASVNLLGDVELVNVSAKEIAKKIKNLDYDMLVGPEVKVVPLIHQLATITKSKNYIIFRKNIMGYMVKPVMSFGKDKLVLDGRDAELLKGKKVIIVDDVVSSGKTTHAIIALLKTLNTKVVCVVSIFKQGDDEMLDIPNFIYLAKLPLFRN
ncbi:adenine phosphoribosyltransferase [Patescibacteria group bacterium]|nr:adenine phosphoribosyltransferase [Patescibacteria group bacterium]